MSAPASALTPVQHLASGARIARSSSLLNSIRSESARLLRPGFVGIGLLVEAAVMVLFTLGTFLAVSDDPSPHAFGILTDLEAPGGIIEAVKSANNFLAIVVMAWAAVAVAGDYTSGLVRLLVQAEPRRWRLMVGKFVALAALAVAAAAVATVVTLVASPIVAKGQDISTAQWGPDSVGPIATTFANLALGLLVWAAIEFAVAVLTRSVSFAIASAIAYGLVIENLLVALRDGLRDWLPGGTVQALIDGGNDVMGYQRALVLAIVYTVGSVVIALAIFQRRDITS